MGNPGGNVEFIRLDTLDPQFAIEFEKCKVGFLRVLSHSYALYYGDDYHVRRIVDGRSILYFALAEHEVIAVSYVKRNFRRGGTAVYPEVYRRLGVAETLVTASLKDFPEQYSFLSVSNTNMVKLLLKLGFVRATSVKQVRKVTQDEFKNLSNFAVSDAGVVFRRHSPKRASNREMLILLYRAPNADAR